MNYETGLYLSDCVDEVFLRGETKFDADNVEYLIRAVNAITWKDPAKCLPEAMSRYVGRKAIPCLVVVAPPKSRPGRKPRVTVAQRRWDGGFRSEGRWVWSRNLDVIKWRELPEAD